MVNLPFVRCFVLRSCCHFVISLLFSRSRQSHTKTISSFRAERMVYYRHRSKARAYPEKYLSLILDGMDQAKTNIPHYPSDSKVSVMHNSLFIRLRGRGNYLKERFSSRFYGTTIPKSQVMHEKFIIYFRLQ